MNDKIQTQTPEQLRQEIRDKALGQSKRKRVLVKMFGTEFELEQSTMGKILDEYAATTNAQQVATTIIENSYVPDTKIKVFEEADREMIINWPFGEDIINLQDAIAELNGITEEKIAAIMEQLKNDPLEGAS